MHEVVGQNVDVIFTISTPAAIAAKNATSKVPIVAAEMGDPVGTGLAASLGHPKGNLTGTSLGYVEGMAGKWLELLQETVPHLSQIAVIGNSDHPVVQQREKELDAIAPGRGVKLRFFQARGPRDIDRSFQQARRTSQAVLLIADPVTMTHRRLITGLAAQHRLPAIYSFPDFVNDAGGLMAYAPNRAVMFRRAADYVDRILRGAKPSDLPIEQPTQYELIINLKTAKALGITIPESILQRADEVIR
jgi:putative ABC transport system substrate-binding protein